MLIGQNTCSWVLHGVLPFILLKALAELVRRLVVRQCIIHVDLYTDVVFRAPEYGLGNKRSRTVERQLRLSVSAFTQKASVEQGCGCIASATERKGVAYSSLLRQPDTEHAASLAMPARLVCSRLAFDCIPHAHATAAHPSSIPPSQTMVMRLACIAPATEREQIAYSSLLRRSDAVDATHQAMPARLVCSSLACACIPHAHATAARPSSIPPSQNTAMRLHRTSD